MIHTFELSRMIGRETYEQLIKDLKGISYNRVAWFTKAYQESGIPFILLYKFKQKRKNEQKQLIELPVQLPEEPYRYMIVLSINIGMMFGNNGYLATDILAFTPPFIRAIYDRIFELIPLLEYMPEQRELGIMELETTGKTIKLESYYWNNEFKLRRIDFAFDLRTMANQYMTLIERGYCIQRKSFQRCYYENEILLDLEDDEYDIEDDIMEEYVSDTKSIYYKSKSLNINIYLKGEQLKKDSLITNDNSDYDYLRIEVQVKKSKLNAIKTKFHLMDRTLEYMATPMVEEYVLKSYVKALTGTGTYVSYNKALNIIDTSTFTQSKKNKLKSLIKAISDKHGIAKVLEQIENGTITEFGKLPTAKNYLRDIHNLGINPVTLSARMKIHKTKLKHIDDETDTIKEHILLGLLDVLSTYGKKKQEYQQNSIPITDEAGE